MSYFIPTPLYGDTKNKQTEKDNKILMEIRERAQSLL